jgi:PAS domain S-box-containing protein
MTSEDLQKATEADRLAELSERLAAIVESSDDAIISKDLNGVIATWNGGAERLFGYTAAEVIGKPITILIPEQHLDEEPAILERLKRGERIDHYETVRKRKDGRLIEISLTVSPVKNAEGRIVGASKIARDITERKLAEERIRLLAREVDHRAKNLLALVQATVHLTRADTPEELKRAIEGRIRAIANAHTLIAQSRWAGANFHTLVVEELAPFGRHPDVRAEIEGPDLILQPATAQSMAIALHELATNAAKYGALSTPNGRVRVEWSVSPDARFAFRWLEKGGPPVAPPRRRGVGTRVIEQVVEGQMKGEVRLDWRAEGLVCEVVVPNIHSAIVS